MKNEKIVIIGSGPAGLTSALYTARAFLDPLIISGVELGGKISITNDVQNYIGFPDGTTGPELVEKMRKHVESFNARMVIDEVTKVELTGGPPFIVTTYQETYSCEVLIIATGASPKRLHVPGEENHIGKGVSFCATCDGFFFRDKEVLVIGGGDSAVEEALFLTKFAKNVTIVHHRDELRAGEALKKAAFENSTIHYRWNTVIEEIKGDPLVSSVTAREVTSNRLFEIETDGVFIFIGHYPNTDLFKEQLSVDSDGYLVTDERMMTTIPGIFAAGEVQDKIYRQIATSVGQGCAAGMSAIRRLQDHSRTNESG